MYRRTISVHRLARFLGIERQSNILLHLYESMPILWATLDFKFCRRVNFVIHFIWGCTTSYRPLSYPFISLPTPLYTRINSSASNLSLHLSFFDWCKVKLNGKSIAVQGTKGIRQWLINLCTFQMMIYKITPFADYN